MIHGFITSKIIIKIFTVNLLDSSFLDPSLNTQVRLESSASIQRVLDCDVTLELYHSLTIIHYASVNFHSDPPPCKGSSLPDRTLYFERFYEDEVDDFVSDGRRLNTVPCYINIYRDDSDLLFSTIFCRVPNASACIILTAATTKEVSQTRNNLKNTHRLKIGSCYRNANNKLRCFVVFCPRREVPITQCQFNQKYSKYQNSLISQQERRFTIFQRRIYMDNGQRVVDVCYQRNTQYVVALYDLIDPADLVQTVQRNEQRGFYLTDGNARMEGDRMVYSAVFSTQTYGSCDYRVIYNIDALQLYEREIALSRSGYRITTIIPTTGDLTPRYVAVFWK